MRKLILTTALAIGVAVVPATAMAKPMKHAAHAMKEKSLYERLGGAPAVSAVIDADPHDGEAGEGDEVKTDVENLTGGAGGEGKRTGRKHRTQRFLTKGVPIPRK